MAASIDNTKAEAPFIVLARMLSNQVCDIEQRLLDFRSDRLGPYSTKKTEKTGVQISGQGGGLRRRGEAGAWGTIGTLDPAEVKNPEACEMENVLREVADHLDRLEVHIKRMVQDFDG